MLFASVIAGFGTGAGLIVSIGSQNAFVLRQGLQCQHVGLIVATCIFADILLISCGVAGIGFIVQQWPVVLDIFRFGGAAFLGVNAFHSAVRAWKGTSGLTPASELTVNRNQVLFACLGYTFLNPHVYLDTMIMIGSLSSSYSGFAQWGFGLGAILASIVWFISLGYGSKLLLPVFRSPVAWRILDALVAILLMTLSVMLLLTPLS
ncbi:Arginine exporter protein ArgO [Vibrio aerogenes CECT 7868]|uniref:Arginine exporter protein ArgO n=1 Tax=Vibrio aerogenes CECT 7868 TaxID=1216006 RepID=A0A1M5XC90_9VIBR|nr:LysE/ArgO family amino acid transporter [Vibrio aerogenes]SHH97144.1 Arginine exporter protein ArgO [Vibrio aerogenes CECT 7868]